VKTVRRLTDGPIGKCDATRARAARLNCMTSLPAEMVLISDEDLQRLAEEKGPTSAEAQALAQLKSQRGQDLQVHCFRVGDTYLTGPLPEATEPASVDIDIIDALKLSRKD
jgi:hypothetical protein